VAAWHREKRLSCQWVVQQQSAASSRGCFVSRRRKEERPSVAVDSREGDVASEDFGAAAHADAKRDGERGEVREALAIVSVRSAEAQRPGLVAQDVRRGNEPE